LRNALTSAFSFNGDAGEADGCNEGSGTDGFNLEIVRDSSFRTEPVFGEAVIDYD